VRSRPRHAVAQQDISWTVGAIETTFERSSVIVTIAAALSNVQFYFVIYHVMNGGECRLETPTTAPDWHVSSDAFNLES
jgi:hypothetical protein